MPSPNANSHMYTNEAFMNPVFSLLTKSSKLRALFFSHGTLLLTSSCIMTTHPKGHQVGAWRQYRLTTETPFAPPVSRLIL